MGRLIIKTAAEIQAEREEQERRRQVHKCERELEAAKDLLLQALLLEDDRLADRARQMAAEVLDSAEEDVREAVLEAADGRDLD